MLKTLHLFRNVFKCLQLLTFWPQVIGAGLSLAGSIFGNKKSSDDEREAAQVNYLQSKEFAQNKIKWAVRDGKSVGLSPLASVGSPGVSYMPTRTGHDYGDLGLSKFGEDISRAMAVKMSNSERGHLADKRYYEKQKMEQDLQIGTLQIQRLQREMQNQPPSPVDTLPQKSLGVKDPKPMQQYRVSDQGRIHKLLADQVSDALENDWMAKVKYFAEQLKIDSSAQWKYLRNKLKAHHKDRRYKVMMLKQKYKIARELNTYYGTNIDTKHIGYDWAHNQFYVKSKYLHLFQK